MNDNETYNENMEAVLSLSEEYGEIVVERTVAYTEGVAEDEA